MSSSPSQRYVLQLLWDTESSHFCCNAFLGWCPHFLQQIYSIGWWMVMKLRSGYVVRFQTIVFDELWVDQQQRSRELSPGSIPRWWWLERKELNDRNLYITTKGPFTNSSGAKKKPENSAYLLNEKILRHTTFQEWYTTLKQMCLPLLRKSLGNSRQSADQTALHKHLRQKKPPCTPLSELHITRRAPRDPFFNFVTRR